MANVIAHIRLANGETGYYDDKSGIFLNWMHPEADVTDDMELSGLRTSRRCHRIKVLSGSLGKAKTFKHILAEAKAKRLGVPVEHILHEGKKRAVYEKTAEVPAEKLAVKIKEEPKEAADAPKKKEASVKAEPIKEAPKKTEEPVEEKKAPAKKAPAKKTAAKKTADKADSKKAEDKEKK